jgi:hypothetical protein
MHKPLAHGSPNLAELGKIRKSEDLVRKHDYFVSSLFAGERMTEIIVWETPTFTSPTAP